jgi:hypothetical protein
MPERRKVNGKTGSVLVPSDKADVVRTAYRIYKRRDTSLQDIVNYFRNNGINVNATESSNMDRSHFSRLLESPLYVRADKDVYQYLVSAGYEVLDDVEMFDGIHGIFRHERTDGTEYVKVGYHEGLVDSETWLAVQDKKLHNQKFPNNTWAKNSWLVGLTKCGHCGYSLAVFPSWNAKHTKQWRYYGDNGAYRANGCVKKRLQIKPNDVEEIVFNAMKGRLNDLVIAKSTKASRDSEVESLKTDVIRCNDEIRELMDKLAKADEILFNYIQTRIKALHERKQELES